MSWYVFSSCLSVFRVFCCPVAPVVGMHTWRTFVEYLYIYILPNFPFGGSPYLFTRNIDCYFLFVYKVNKVTLVLSIHWPISVGPASLSTTKHKAQCMLDGNLISISMKILHNKRLRCLTMTALVKGTKYSSCDVISVRLWSGKNK